MVWRGFDNVSDHYIFPNEPLKAIITCLTISHVIYLIVILVQKYLYKRFSKSYLFPRLLVEDIFHLIMLASTVLSWKFYWNSIDYFFYTKSNAFYIYTIGHFVSFVIALRINVSAMLVGPGTSLLDGEITESKSYFEINYFSSLFEVS